MGIDTIIDGYR